MYKKIIQVLTFTVCTLTIDTPASMGGSPECDACMTGSNGYNKCYYNCGWVPTTACQVDCRDKWFACLKKNNCPE
jgi:hypothetical protein